MKNNEDQEVLMACPYCGSVHVWYNLTTKQFRCDACRRDIYWGDDEEEITPSPSKRCTCIPGKTRGTCCS